MAVAMHMPQSGTTVRTMGGLDILAGVWLIIAPFLFNYSANGGSIVSDVVVGILVLFLAGVQVVGDNYRLSWPSWINTLLGIWLIVAPFALGYPSGSAAIWNDVVLGIVVVLVSIIGAFSASSDEVER